jgi:anti-anti-sigma regulatory factor
MPAEKGDRWIVADLMPGVRSVRFTQPSLSGDGETVFRELWDQLLETVNPGDVVILNFLQVEDYDSCFLAGLFRAGVKLRQHGGLFIGCHLNDELLGTWRVTGLSQPIDFLLNYVNSEEEAIGNARFLQG